MLLKRGGHAVQYNMASANASFSFDSLIGSPFTTSTFDIFAQCLLHTPPCLNLLGGVCSRGKG